MLKGLLTKKNKKKCFFLHSQSGTDLIEAKLQTELNVTKAWLKQNDTELVLLLLDTGTHSDIF